MLYSILVRWGSGWDGQSVIYTKSKALFDALSVGENTYFNDGFSEELKQEIVDKFNSRDFGTQQPLDEDMDLIEAMEWLEQPCVIYPITVLDHTEFTPHWNW